MTQVVLDTPGPGQLHGAGVHRVEPCVEHDAVGLFEQQDALASPPEVTGQGRTGRLEELLEQ